MKREIMLGSDPEIFMEHGNGSLFPAFEFLPSKYEPLKNKDGNAFYYDGYQAEMTVKPSTNIDEVLKSIKAGLNSILKEARKKDKKAHFSMKNVVDVDLKSMESLPMEYTMFGCDPSLNAYGLSGIAADGHTIAERWSGGHVHMSPMSHDVEEASKNATALDAILGVVSVSLMENMEPALRRRMYYGLPSEHRLPIYPDGTTGLEYRVLSSAWVNSPKSARFVLDLTRRVVEFRASDDFKWSADTDEVIECIVRSDVGMARKMIERNMDNLVALGLETDINILAPIEESIEMKSVEKNWELR